MGGGVSSAKCSSTISLTDFKDKGWKDKPQSATNILKHSNLSSSPISLHLFLASSALNPRYWQRSTKWVSLLFFMAFSLCSKEALILATSEASSVASSDESSGVRSASMGLLLLLLLKQRWDFLALFLF